MSVLKITHINTLQTKYYLISIETIEIESLYTMPHIGHQNNAILHFLDFLIESYVRQRI